MDMMNNVRKISLEGLEFLEYKPKIRTIRFKDRLRYGKSETKIFSLPFPYLRFGHISPYMFVNAGAQPLESTEEKFYSLPLPHMNASFAGLVCINSALNDLNSLIDKFWNSYFVLGYDYGYRTTTKLLNEWNKLEFDPFLIINFFHSCGTEFTFETLRTMRRRYG